MAATKTSPTAANPKRNGTAPVPRAKIETITPTKAKKLLSGNTHNRNIRPRRVERLVGAIKRGEWTLNGEAIQLAADGKILNGQHRLLAVVEADEPIESLVVYGLPVEAQETIDTGAARTVSDILKLRGYTNTAQLASTARIAWAYDVHGAPLSTARTDATPQQVVGFIEANPQLHDHLQPAKLVSEHGVGLPVSWGGALSFLFAREFDPYEASEFMVRLAYGDGMTSDHPIFKVRNQLVRARSRAREHRLAPLAAAAYTIKAFNAWVLGEKPQLIFWRPTGRTPEQFPRILRKEETR